MNRQINSANFTPSSVDSIHRAFVHISFRSATPLSAGFRDAIHRTTEQLVG